MGAAAPIVATPFLNDTPSRPSLLRLTRVLMPCAPSFMIGITKVPPAMSVAFGACFRAFRRSPKDVGVTTVCSIASSHGLFFAFTFLSIIDKRYGNVKRLRAMELHLMTEDMSELRSERASEAIEFSDTDFVNSPLRQRLKDVLLRRILGGAYKSGERLIELRIAQEFGTSQAPVREALRDLEATGLVISKPRRGTYVAEVLSEGLREIYAVRGALEEQATRLATLKQSCDLATLELELQGMRVAAAANDHASLAEHSVKFHRAIVDAAGNRLLTNLWLSLNIETRTTITLLVDGIDLMEAAESHRQIIDAIASGDSERASRVAREHQENFERLPTPNTKLRKE